jgi:hypothetical protein
MTGLPAPMTPPADLPPVPALVLTARVWLRCAEALGSAGVDQALAPRWTGLAGSAARRRARSIQRRCDEVAARGLSGVAALGAWGLAMRRLDAERWQLTRRVDADAADLRGLFALPDDVPAAPVLRRVAWRRHERLRTDLAAWVAARQAADEELARSLDTAGAASHTEALDAAHRSLLALDDSRAAAATRAALAQGADARLLVYEPEAYDGDGAVVVAYGDPERADHLAVVVPGITNDASTIDDVGVMARNVAAAATAAGAGPTVSVAWIGYDAPSGRVADLARTVGTDAADDGADELRSFADGIAIRSPRAEVTVIGHSYGATTAATAAHDGLRADRLVLLGSPGAGDDATRADDLHLPTWVASDDLDPVTWVGAGPAPRLGADPASDDFGATRLPTDPAPPPHLDEAERFVAIHNAYLDSGSTLTAVGAVVAGDSPAGVPLRTASGTELALDWLAGQTAYELTSWR